MNSNMNTMNYIRKMLSVLPDYISDYEKSLTLSDWTKKTYLADLKQYMDYIIFSIPEYRNFTTKSLPLYALTERTTDELNDWLNSLKSRSGEPAANTYIAKKISSLRAFYYYLREKNHTVHDPAALLIKPEILQSTPDFLSEKDIDILFSGIQKNHLFLVRPTSLQGSGVPYITGIDSSTRLKREKQLTRNIAILSILIDMGLRVSEIAALNTDDIDFSRKAIRVLRNDEFVYLPYSSNVRDKLSAYLHGPDVPETLLKRQMNPGRNDFLAFCRHYMLDPAIRLKASKRFSKTDNEFLDDIETCAAYLRRKGRSLFDPENITPALFLSNRGSRISVRMIEQMVKDMVATYLPEKYANQQINPLKLRSMKTVYLMETGAYDELIQFYGFTEKGLNSSLRKLKNPENGI